LGSREDIRLVKTVPLISGGPCLEWWRKKTEGYQLTKVHLEVAVITDVGKCTGEGKLHQDWQYHKPGLFTFRHFGL